MRAFKDEYWLYLPKPWRSREFADLGDRKQIAKKCKRIEELVRTINTVKKKRRNNIRHDYTEGESLFLLPKTLSKGIRLWKNYEARLKSWLANHVSQRSPVQRSSLKALEDRGYSPPASHESSALTHHSSFYEEDPLRGFYTIWHFNTTRVPKTKLSSTERIYEYLDSVSKSAAVEHHISKPPKGGVSGRIDDPSSLSAKGRDTLQRWSRLASHYDVGEESGEDEDPVEMWNRTVEASILHNNTTDFSLAMKSPLRESPGNLTKSKTKNSPANFPDGNCLTETRSRRSTGSVKQVDQAQTVEGSSPRAFHTSEDSEKGATSTQPPVKLKNNLISQCENRPTPSRPDAAGASELRRRASLRFALKSRENTPVRKPEVRGSLEKVSSLTKSGKIMPESNGSVANPNCTVTPKEDYARDEIEDNSVISAKRRASNTKTPKSTADDSPSITLSSLRKRRTETPKTDEGTPKNKGSREKPQSSSANKVITPKSAVKTPASSSKRFSELDSIDRSFSKRPKRFSSSTPNIELRSESSMKLSLRTPSKRTTPSSSPLVKSCK